MFYRSRLQSQDLSPCFANCQVVASETCNMNFGHLTYSVYCADGVDGVDGVVGLVVPVGYEKRWKQTCRHQRRRFMNTGS